MARRHNYTMRFRCPKCKRAGLAKWEEHERIVLPHGPHNSTLKHVADGFRANPQHEIQCAACGVPVVYGH